MCIRDSDATGGLIMAEAVTFALAEAIGKSEAHHLVEAASKQAVAEKKHLRDVLAGNPKVSAHLSADKLTQLFDPMAYQGVSQALIDRLLASLDNLDVIAGLDPAIQHLEETPFRWMCGSSPCMMRNTRCQ